MLFLIPGKTCALEEAARSAMVANGIAKPCGFFPHPALRATFSRTREKRMRAGPVAGFLGRGLPKHSDIYNTWFVVCKGRLSPCGVQHRHQPITSLTGLPTRLSISTKVSMVNLTVFLFTTSDTRGRETIRISAASACFR